MLASLAACLHQLESLVATSAATPTGQQTTSSFWPGTIHQNGTPRAPPFSFPLLKRLHLHHLSISSADLQPLLDSCPSLNDLSLGVSCSSLSIRHPRLNRLAVTAANSQSTSLLLDARALVSLKTTHVAHLAATVSPEMHSLVIDGSCGSLSFSPLPSRLSRFVLKSCFMNNLLISASLIVKASWQSLATLQLSPTVRPHTGPQVLVTPSASASGDSTVLASSTRRAVWKALQKCANLSSLTVDASLVLIPKEDAVSFPQLAHLSVTVWDCRRFFSREAELSGSEALTWAKLTREIPVGCRKLTGLQLWLAESIVPESLGTICEGHVRMNGVKLSYYSIPRHR